MIFTLKMIKSNQFDKYLLWFLSTVYLVIFLVSLRTYIVWESVNLILGLISIPFITTIDYGKRDNKRFAFAAIGAVVLSWIIPVKTMLFVSILFGILFLIDNFYGKINSLPVFACLLISPFFQYAVTIFSFSIRIILSSVAGKLLNLVGDTVIVSGNLIEVQGKEFAVDPECMGLNMMVTTILLGILLIGVVQKKLQKVINLWQVISLLAVVFVFNIISNLLRIILLVKFAIMPEDTMHEITGLICLFMYVCVPSILVVRWTVNRFGRRQSIQNTSESKQPFYPGLHLFILFSIALISFKVDKKEPVAFSVPKSLPALPGSMIESVADNIIKIQSADVLIYIKPILNFYESEHNPSICWKGSGYEMKKINTDNIGTIKINTAELKKDKSTLFTAWWFDNGQHQTVSQLDWRWKMFKRSKPFSVINITAATKKELEQQVTFFLANKLDEQILLSRRSPL